MRAENRNLLHWKWLNLKNSELGWVPEKREICHSPRLLHLFYDTSKDISVFFLAFVTFTIFVVCSVLSHVYTSWHVDVITRFRHWNKTQVQNHPFFFFEDEIKMTLFSMTSSLLLLMLLLLDCENYSSFQLCAQN